MTQPAYLRIADNLRQRIVKGTLAPGDRVPSRHELAREHGVSDRVAVEAVRLLVAEGYLESRSGSGTYVRQRPKVKRLTRSWYRGQAGAGSPFRADMESQGRAGTWRSISETSTASSSVAERLGVAEGDPVMETRYTFLADDRPVMLSTSWEPLEITRDTPVMLPEEGPYAGAGVVARMRAIGQDVALATEVVSARGILADEAERLGEPVGSIVTVIQRTYLGERPLETAEIVVPVERYELVYAIPVD
ncbi:GntR family transcriptional regulator [Spirillospora sp. CA-128828]|uniref:GntR family transcriptional regulator n=1 Tax=Spirillospora sp. CA-128828 TaxID=3240033 RepID=UPI003D8E3DF5